MLVAVVRPNFYALIWSIANADSWRPGWAVIALILIWRPLEVRCREHMCSWRIEMLILSRQVYAVTKKAGTWTFTKQTLVLYWLYFEGESPPFLIWIALFLSIHPSIHPNKNTLESTSLVSLGKYKNINCAINCVIVWQMLHIFYIYFSVSMATCKRWLSWISLSVSVIHIMVRILTFKIFNCSVALVV